MEFTKLEKEKLIWDAAVSVWRAGVEIEMEPVSDEGVLLGRVKR